MIKSTRRIHTTAALALLAILAGAIGCQENDQADPPDAPPAGTSSDPTDQLPDPLPDDEGSGSSDASDPAENLQPLTLELPTPAFKGTPKNIRVANLRPIRKGPRPMPLVPENVTNVARNQPVDSSDPEPIIGELSVVTDGNKAAEEGAYVELGFGQQWVQVDLGEPMEVFAIVLWHYHMEGRVYHDVIVQVSNDPDFVEGVTTVYNDDHDNSSGMGAGEDLSYVETFEGRLIDAGGAVGRYVRCYSRGNTSNDMNHYTELEVYGRPAE
jgi:hypothetical protein